MQQFLVAESIRQTLVLEEIIGINQNFTFYIYKIFHIYKVFHNFVSGVCHITLWVLFDIS